LVTRRPRNRRCLYLRFFLVYGLSEHLPPHQTISESDAAFRRRRRLRGAVPARSPNPRPRPLRSGARESWRRSRFRRRAGLGGRRGATDRCHIPPQTTMLPRNGRRPRTNAQRLALAGKARANSDAGVWEHQGRVVDAEGEIAEPKKHHGLDPRPLPRHIRRPRPTPARPRSDRPETARRAGANRTSAVAKTATAALSTNTNQRNARARRSASFASNRGACASKRPKVRVCRKPPNFAQMPKAQS
jgi:hypothetical protein